MTKRRLKLQVGLGELPPETRWLSRTAVADDRQALAELLLAAYSGTIDDEGETPAEALAEIDRTLAGAYGPYLERCSFVVEVGGALAAACLITLWNAVPLVAFVMVAPRHQQQGLGRLVLRQSMRALWAQGYPQLVLYVTDGNAPAQQLYERLGFTVVQEP